MKKTSGRVLGKGLDALIADHKTIEPSKNEVLKLNINQVVPNEDQPRKDLVGIEELSKSIKSFGIIQPIIVLDAGANYKIIAGERRWRAAKMAGLKEVPVIVKDKLTDMEVMEIAIIENVQRKDLNPIEEAMAYKELIDKFKLSIDGVARSIGKDRSTITNIMRLLLLPVKVQEQLRQGMIQQGHVRPLIGIKDEKLVVQVAAKIISEKLSVREVEALVKTDSTIVAKKPVKAKKPAPKKLDSDLKSYAEKIQQKFSTKVNISGNISKGKILIEYYSQDDLDRILELLNN